MTKMFSNFTSEQLDEQAEDRLGGYSPLESGCYLATIKALYAGASDGGAQNLTLLADIGGREYRETIYFTNKGGDNFYMTKNSKKAPLPGFITVDHICLVATGAPLAEQETEEKVVKVWDREARTEVPRKVPMITAAIGQQIELGILKVMQNKTEKQGNEYVPIADTVDSNLIDKVFDPETKKTVVEALNDQEATFYEAWRDKNSVNTRDKRTIKDGQGGTAGRPSASRPTAGGDAPARKNLFGK
jgi:hypothetical protein